MTDALPWWRTDTYDVADPMPQTISDAAGPNGVALVKAWPDGRTDKGWGLNPPPNSTDGFMPRYLRGEFNSRRVIFGYERGKWAFAFIMRSLKLVCIDIDGKNGGFDQAKLLGMLPPTMSETSKSGNGYHLFYLVDEEWDDDLGFGEISDRIGIVQGVDVRGTGCVYHHDTQRWNGREPAMLPDHLKATLLHRAQKIADTNARITKVLASSDDMEILMMQDELISELNKPIGQGKRNHTLFAIGSQMATAQVDDWENLVSTRATQVGLDPAEAGKLVANIQRYSGKP